MKRYHLLQTCSMFDDKNGQWCLYEDVKELEAKNKRFLKETRQAQKGMGEVAKIATQQIKELKALIQRAIDAKMWTSDHACWIQLYDDLENALEGKK